MLSYDEPLTQQAVIREKCLLAAQSNRWDEAYDLHKTRSFVRKPGESSVVRFAGQYQRRPMGWIFVCSLLFTLVAGYAAVTNRAAGSIILQALDVLQSVSSLGILSATVADLIALFRGSLLSVGVPAFSRFLPDRFRT